MIKKRVLTFWLSAFLILSVVAWGVFPAAFVSSLGNDPSEGVTTFFEAWFLLAFFTFIPWTLVLLLLTIHFIRIVPTHVIKIGLGLGMIPILIIAGLYSWLMAAMGYNEVSLKLNSPVAYYMSNQEPDQSIDIAHFFETTATKSDVLAALSESGYNWRKMSNEAYDQWFEDSLAKDPPIFEYDLQRSITCIPTIARMGTRLRVNFDENDKLISATGFRSPCYM